VLGEEPFGFPQGRCVVGRAPKVDSVRDVVRLKSNETVDRVCHDPALSTGRDTQSEVFPT